MNVDLQKHLLMVGPTGTGKTVNVIDELNNNYFNDEFTFLNTAFSGKTQCNQVQKQIENKMSTKRRKGRYGPEDNKAKIVIFIDDFNIPIKNRYNSQPPVEVIRQVCDSRGFYDLETKDFKILEDFSIISAMGPPSQGRNQITLRCSQHFNIVYVESFQQISLQKIFGSVIETFFKTQGEGFQPVIKAQREKLVNGAISIYNKAKSSKTLLPIPSRPHYTYNLRDLAKVFQGILKVTIQSQANPLAINQEHQLMRLLIHECKRVFQDRLINAHDQQHFDNILKEALKEFFNKVKKIQQDWNQVIQQEPLLFTSFIPTIKKQNDEFHENIYCEIVIPQFQTDYEHLKKSCYDKLEEYNHINYASRMDLVMFMNATEHILRICRMISFQQGHGLLIGMGGSGRRSLTQLSAFISRFQLVTVDNRYWIEDLQKVLKVVGIEQKNCILVVSDSQKLNDTMYEDISYLLNNGEVPNLFQLEEKAKIVEEISNQMPIGTTNQKYAYFVSKCKEFLRLVICMSPVGNQFRKLVRTFPSLVNCTTIDWYLTWPNDALISTAKYSIQDFQMEGQNQHQLRQGIVDLCVDMQIRVTNLTSLFLQEQNRYYYVTPTSYLELLSTFKQMYQDRNKQIKEKIVRYDQGLSKLISVEGEVIAMQEKLEKLKPILIEKNRKNNILLENLQINQEAAEVQKGICQQESVLCDQQREEATELKISCQGDLQKVLPLLEEASRALEKIKQEDITLIKSFTSPPPTLDLLMQAVIIALGEDGNVKWKNIDPNDPSKGKIQDYWDFAKKYLLNNKLIKRIQQYKEDKIRQMNVKGIEKLKKICENPEFRKEKVFKVSEPAGNLSLWIRACVETFAALLIVDPKRQKLAQAEERLIQSELKLELKKQELQKVMDLLQKLEDDYAQAIKEKEELEEKVDTVARQLDRAQKLITGLGSEKISWTKKLTNFKEAIIKMIGDVLLCSGFVAYLGVFNIAYRDSCLTEWKRILSQHKIPFAADFSLQETLVDANTLGQWVNKDKLPNDRVSVENALIQLHSRRYSLLIDPQNQAEIWLKHRHQNMVILRNNQNQTELSYAIENAIFNGQVMVLQGIDEDIDPIFNDLLQNQVIYENKKAYIKFMDKQMDYNPEFKFYITTKLPNPHYSPEICVRVTILNFMVTQEGLDDQMLNIVVKIEEPVKDDQRQRNIKEYFDNTRKQKETEDKILQLLANASGNILEDEVLIDMLQQSKIESNEIEEKLEQIQIQSDQFKVLQNFYRDVAKLASNLYFVIQDLSLIEPVYNFSLDFYIEIYEKSIENAHSGRFERIKNINNNFQLHLYKNIIHSLLEKDKLIFSLMICLRIMQYEKKIITGQEVRFIMIGSTLLKAQTPNPCSSWVSDKQWAALEEISQTFPHFKNFNTQFESLQEQWQSVFNSAYPYMTKDNPWPEPWLQNLNAFQKLMLVKIFCPNKLYQGFQQLITDFLGASFIDYPPLDLYSLYEESSPFKPLVFILSPESNPISEVETLASQCSMSNQMVIKSMGQGQGDITLAAILDASVTGKWVYVQNCHLGISSMPRMEDWFENMPANIHKDFRLLLTLVPFKEFPVNILQKAVKITYEVPKGIKNSILRAYYSVDFEQIDQGEKRQVNRKLLFGLSLFHAIVLERRKYGPLGWNIPYQFSISDLMISVDQFVSFNNQFQEIQWDALYYLVAEANYGGRVTDNNDRRLMAHILPQFFGPKLLKDNCVFSSDGVYHQPEDGNLKTYLDFINKLPVFDKPEVFGLHENSQIQLSINLAESVCATVLQILPRVVEGGTSAESSIKEKIQKLLQEIPQPFNINHVKDKYPVMYEQSMNVVLQQDLQRYNNVVLKILSNLSQVIQGLDGLLSFTNELEEVYNAILVNKVPAIWSSLAYPSLKPLGSWILNFLERLKFMQDWVDHGIPTTFWISGFFFTESFFTGVLQNYSRKYELPIDCVIFDFQPVRKNDPDCDTTKHPTNGAYINGLYLDACKWNDDEYCIEDQENNVLYYQMCDIYCKPINMLKTQLEQSQRFLCPVYRTTLRKGDLTSTGHSTNYVISIPLPIKEIHSTDFWIKRGVALFCSLST